MRDTGRTAASTRAEEGDKMAATMTKTLFLQKVQTFSQSSEFSVWCEPSWWWQTCCANRRMSTPSLYSKANAAISYGKRGSAFPHVAESVFLGASDKIVFRQSAEQRDRRSAGVSLFWREFRIEKKRKEGKGYHCKEGENSIYVLSIEYRQAAKR